MWDSGRQQQQVRQIMVDVVKDDLERAIRKLMRRLKEDGTIRVMRSRQYFQKPSELKVLAAKERDKRIQKKAFREKLKWIMERRSR
jgi:small subunit ribosomal protein S21